MSICWKCGKEFVNENNLGTILCYDCASKIPMATASSQIDNFDIKNDEISEEISEKEKFIAELERELKKEQEKHCDACYCDLQRENEQLKQQLAEKNKLLENAIVPVLKNFIDKYLNFIEIGVDPLCKCYFCIVHDIAGKEIANKTGYDINKVFFEAIKEAEEALKKLNKEQANERKANF